MKVVIFGGFGFVGRNLETYLLRERAYDLVTPHHSIVDAADPKATTDFLLAQRPDVVVNLAAYVGGIGFNSKHPADMLGRNLLTGLNIVHACLAARVGKLVYLGSVCAYPHTPPRIPFREDDLWAGRPEPTNEPYGLAKKTIGLYLDACQRQHGLASAYLIPTNMYGPHDNFDPERSHVIPAMLRKFHEAWCDKSRTVTLWGDGTASREFLYVEDCCRAIDLAIERVDTPIPINVGTGEETTMRELADVIATNIGFNGDIRWDASRPNGQPRRCLDVSRAEAMLGFKATTSLHHGLFRTGLWYLQSLQR